MRNTDVEYLAREVNRILNNGINILPNSPIHIKLKEALIMRKVGVSVPTSTKQIFEVEDTGVKYVHKMTCEVIDGRIVMVDNGFVKVTDE